MTSTSSLVVISFLIVFASCGGALNTNPQPTVNAGSPGETSPPSPRSQQPLLWQNVHEQITCEALAPNYCLGLYGFSVDNLGNYEVGPAPDGATKGGVITPNELAALDLAAMAVANNRSESQICSLSKEPPGTGEDVTETFSDETTDEIYHKQWGQTCYRDGIANSNALQSEINTLMNKYYPKPFPETLH